jgi:hypothetical protein
MEDAAKSPYITRIVDLLFGKSFRWHVKQRATITTLALPMRRCQHFADT